MEPPSLPTLCLNMIVKNEGKIITRLLNSVVNIIDCYCICDTGSTDDTVTIIENYFSQLGIPGKVVHEPFKNFCHNRNVALQSAVGLSDFVLLLDADMILEVKHFHKQLLCAGDQFHLFQGHDGFYYQNMRIVRNNGLYKYVGVTHEYIDVPPETHTVTIDREVVFILDVGDGGSKSNKFERDAQLLLDGLKEDPQNVRYHFYLANTYHDSGKYAQAIEYYQKRIELGGWFEEIWYSYYRLGLCLKHVGRFNDAVAAWLDGYAFYPERLEALHEMIHHYRVNSKHKLCKLYYDVAKTILDKKHNRDAYLFLHNDVYTYKLYYEYTIFAAYVGVNNINNEVVTILNHCHDEGIINNLFSNMKFYKDGWKALSIKSFDKKMIETIDNEDIVFSSSSSCLIPHTHGQGYQMNVRYVNYHIEENGAYKNCEKHIITLNKYVELDAEFNVQLETCFDPQFDGRLYIGVEDVKIYYDRYAGCTRFIGTGFHATSQIGIVSGAYDPTSTQLSPFECKQQFRESGCEKNWVFVDHQNSTQVVYNWYPLTLCQLDSTHHLRIEETKSMPRIFSRVRGSSCGFVYANEIWFVTHLVSYESPRHYYHLVAVFDQHMKLLRYTAPFKFEGEPIEYCLSIIVESSRILMNYSTWDRTTRIGIYDKDFVESKLKYTF